MTEAGRTRLQELLTWPRTISSGADQAAYAGEVARLLDGLRVPAARAPAEVLTALHELFGGRGSARASDRVQRFLEELANEPPAAADSSSRGQRA